MRSKGTTRRRAALFPRPSPHAAFCGLRGCGARGAGCGQFAARSGAGSRQPADGRWQISRQLAAGSAAGGHAVISAAAAAHSRNGALPRISTGGQLGRAGGGCWLRGQVARTRAKSGGRCISLASTGFWGGCKPRYFRCPAFLCPKMARYTHFNQKISYLLSFFVLLSLSMLCRLLRGPGIGYCRRRADLAPVLRWRADYWCVVS
jgi:hypothetical protein